MPVIPTFVSDAPIETPSAGARANPAVAAAPAAMLGEAFERVGQSFAGVAALAQQQTNSADALDATGKLSQSLVEMRAKYADDPDPTTAPARFKAESQQLLQSTLASAPNPEVQRYIATRAARQIPLAYAEVTTGALRAQHQINVSKFQASLSDSAKQLGAAGNDADMLAATSGLNAAIAGGVASRWIRPDQAPAVLSGALRQGIALRAATDPLAAQQMLEAHRDQLDAGDLTALTMALKPQVTRAAGTALGQQVIGGNGGSYTAPPANTDEAFSRMIGVESSGNQMDPNNPGQPLTSPRGAIGRAQVMPDTAQETAAAHGIAWDPAKYRTDADYNTQLGKLYFGDMLARYGGNVTLAAAAYNAGPGRVDQWLASPGVGDPRTGAITDAQFAARIPIAETRNYVGKVMGISAQLPPDVQGQIADIKRRTNDPEVQQIATATVLKANADRNAATAVQTQQLTTDLAQLSTAYLAGHTDAPIPEAQIRALLPPEQAGPLLDQLNVQRKAGDAFSAVKFASPADEAATRATLAPAPDAPPSDTLKISLAVTAEYDRMLTQKRTQLQNDPAAYVATAPGVAPPPGADPNDPATARATMASSLAMQAHMGVPAGSRRVLTNDQVAGLVKQIQGADPSKVDVGAQLDQLSKQFGDLWPQAFGELVQQGKLPRAYKLLAALDSPAQAAVRSDVQSMLALNTQKGGMQAVRQATPQGTTAALKSALDSNGVLDQFRQTSNFGVSGIALDGDMRQSVQDLAYYYMHRDGITAGQAVDKAASGILAGKYDFQGTMRAPKGTMPQVAAAADYVQSGLTANDLAPRPDPSGIRTPEEIRTATLAQAQQAKWAPNGPDDGLVLLYDDRNGHYTPVLRSDGSRVEVKFNALPTPDQAVIDNRRAQDLAAYRARMRQGDPLNRPTGLVPLP